MFYGIEEWVYQSLTDQGLDLSGYFSSTPQMDDRGNYFYVFTGNESEWEDFLLENDLNEITYGLGQFWLLTSPAGTGNL